MIKEAVKFYNFNESDATLIRHNENMTYKIENNTCKYLMRIHKPIEGFNLGLLQMGSDHKKQIEDEMTLLELISDISEIRVQKVIRNINNERVTTLNDGTFVTVLGWLEGETLENTEITKKNAYEIGVMISKMHKTLKSLKLSNRYNYNEILLSEMIKECDKAHEMKHFNDNQADIIKNALDYMRNFFINNKEKLVLVHSDFSKSNMIINQGIVSPIDFSLSGYSVPEMDLASVFSHINDEILNAEILRGYENESGQAINKAAMNICFCFQILLFVICQHNAVAGEPWFSEKLDEWCHEEFTTLLQNNK